MLVVLAVRTGEQHPDDALLAELALDPSVTVLRPAPLSARGRGALVRERLGEGADSFVRACHRMTSGNPLLLRQLLRALEDEGIRPDVSHVDTVRAVGSRAVSALVTLRLRRMPPTAPRLGPSGRGAREEARAADRRGARPAARGPGGSRPRRPEPRARSSPTGTAPDLRPPAGPGRGVRATCPPPSVRCTTSGPRASCTQQGAPPSRSPRTCCGPRAGERGHGGPAARAAARTAMARGVGLRRRAAAAGAGGTGADGRAGRRAARAGPRRDAGRRTGRRRAPVRGLRPSSRTRERARHRDGHRPYARLRLAARAWRPPSRSAAAEAAARRARRRAAGPGRPATHHRVHARAPGGAYRSGPVPGGRRGGRRGADAAPRARYELLRDGEDRAGRSRWRASRSRATGCSTWTTGCSGSSRRTSCCWPTRTSATSGTGRWPAPTPPAGSSPRCR